jgi:hypothetical protein
MMMHGGNLKLILVCVNKLRLACDLKERQIDTVEMHMYGYTLTLTPSQSIRKFCATFDIFTTVLVTI